ncbi:hypothetical protein PUN28_008506 [Cardiocondyla obscurior]|uniref:Uncharacterized protein n=1 Tax=Cardiocondyla obscurior TaxID=286306 RepID=A0AAW2G421_9HYME
MGENESDERTKDMKTRSPFSLFVFLPLPRPENWVAGTTVSILCTSNFLWCVKYHDILMRKKKREIMRINIHENYQLTIFI